MAPERYETGSMPDVFQLVERLARQLASFKRAVMAETGVTPSQFVILDALWQEDRRPLKDLASVARCTPATITGIVDVLERKGLVSRQTNPRDRRSMLVTLTPKGRALRDSAPSMEVAFHGCCTLRPEESARLADLLRRLIRSLEVWEVVT